MKAHFQSSRIVTDDFIFRIYFNGVNRFIFAKPDQPELPGRRNNAPAAVIPVKKIHNAPLAVIVKEFIFIIKNGNLTDMGCLHIDAAGIIVCISTINTIQSVSHLHFHIHRIRRSRVCHIHNFGVSRQILNRRIRFMGRSFRIIPCQSHIPASALPMNGIHGHKRQITVRHPFKERYALSFQIHFLRRVQTV